jgi:hypothetical protein
MGVKRNPSPSQRSAVVAAARRRVGEQHDDGGGAAAADWSAVAFISSSTDVCMHVYSVRSYWRWLIRVALAGVCRDRVAMHGWTGGARVVEGAR